MIAKRAGQQLHRRWQTLPWIAVTLVVTACASDDRPARRLPSSKPAVLAQVTPGAVPMPEHMRKCFPGNGYPAAAAKARASGTTVLRAHVDADGTILRASIEESAGETDHHKVLDAVALRNILCIGKLSTHSAKEGVVIAQFIWKLEE